MRNTIFTLCFVFFQNWYRLSKTVAEKEAIDFASKNALDVITLCPTVIFGPMLQSTVNASSLVIINLLKGNNSFKRNTFTFTPAELQDVMHTYAKGIFKYMHYLWVALLKVEGYRFDPMFNPSAKTSKKILIKLS
jgi:hypothetical protein